MKYVLFLFSLILILRGEIAFGMQGCPGICGNFDSQLCGINTVQASICKDPCTGANNINHCLNSVCLDTTVTLHAAFIEFAPAQISWKDNGVLIPACNNSLSCPILFNSAGQHIISVTGTSTNCTVTACTTYNVDSPVVSITPTNPVACQGGSAILCAQVTGGVPPFTYAWTQNILTPFGNSQCICAPEGFVYQVTVTDSNNCVSNTASVVLGFPTSPLAATVCPSTAAICTASGQMTSTTLTASATGGVPPYSFQWNDPSMTTTPSLTVSVPGTYTVTVTDMCGTTTTAQAVVTGSAGITASIKPAGPLTVCPGSPVTLCATAMGDDLNGLDFSWTGGAIGGTPLTTPCIMESAPITAGASNIYTVVVTNDAGCHSSAQVMVTASNAPTFSNSLMSQTVCQGSAVTFSALVSGGVAPYTYNLHQDTTSSSTCADVSCDPTQCGANRLVATGASLNGTISFTISHAALSDTGTYTLSVTDSCGASAGTSMATLTVTAPDSTIQVEVCSGNPIILDAPVAQNTYTWKDGNGTITVAPSLTINPSDIHNPYTLTALDPAGCCSLSKVDLLVKDCPNVCVNKCGPATISANETFKYVIRIVNCGRAEATGLTVVDNFPPCLTIDPTTGVNAPDWSCTVDNTSHMVTCMQNNPIAPCGMSKIKLTAVANGCTDTITNTVKVTGDAIETATASWPITVQ